MDRPIAQKRWPPPIKLATLAGVLLAGFALMYYVAANTGTSRLSLDPERLSLAQVRRGEFQEYVPVNGIVQPNTTVYLDLEEGGIVERIYVDGGSPINQGDLILSFSNTAVQKQNIETETRLLENLDQLRNSKLSLTQSSLILKDQLLDLNYKIQNTEKTYKRYQELVKRPSSQISQEQFETTQYELNYYRAKRDLLEERIRREAELEKQQNTAIDSSIVRVDRNLDLLAKIIDSLEVRAPINGVLSTLNAEVGQSFQSGQRIGQIDQMDGIKVRADIDQFYISKVAVGQSGTFQMGGRTYRLRVAKIYPEVNRDVFQADMTFENEVPADIKRGQSLQIDLSLSAPQTTQMVAKGGFYRHSNGRWAYVVARDGRSARRTNLVLGRQNPHSVEVLEGIKVGEWIVTSNYDSFNNVDELVFSKPVQARQGSGQ